MKSPLLILSTSFPRSPEDDAGIFVQKLVAALSEQEGHGKVIVPKDVCEETLLSVNRFTIERFTYGIFSPGRLAFGAGIMPNLRRAPLLAFQIPSFIVSFFLKTLKFSQAGSVIQANWIISGFIAWLVSLIKRTPYYITLRGEDLRLLEKLLFRALFTPSLKKAEGIITVSESLRQSFNSYAIVHTTKVFVIENGVDSEVVPADEIKIFREQYTISENEKFLLFVGTVIPRKQIDKIIAILSQPELTDYRLRICGRIDDQSEYKKLQNIIASKNLNKRISFEGPVAPRMVASYLALASGYITMSNFEGRPNALLEALASGTVAFVSDISAHRELIQDQKNGVILQGMSEREDARVIAKTLKDAARCESISREARASVVDLRWQKTARAYLELLCSIRKTK